MGIWNINMLGPLISGKWSEATEVELWVLEVIATYLTQ